MKIEKINPSFIRIAPIHKVEKIVSTVLDSIQTKEDVSDLKLRLTNEILTRQEGAILLVYLDEDGKPEGTVLLWRPFDEFVLVLVGEVEVNYLQAQQIHVEVLPLSPKFKNLLDKEVDKFEQNAEELRELESIHKIQFPEKTAYIPVKILKDPELDVAVVDIFNPYSESQEKYLCSKYGYVKLPRNVEFKSIREYLLALYNIPSTSSKEEVEVILKSQLGG